MKSFGLLPSSPMVKEMTEIQWAYCYLNIAKDLEEEDNLFRMRAKYQGLFVNPDAVKKISEEEEKQKRHNVCKNNGLTQRQEEIIDSGGSINLSFEEELQKALQGEQLMEIPIEGSVRGDSAMSSDDFLAQCMMDFEEEEKEKENKNQNISSDEEEDVDLIIVDDDDDDNKE